MVVFISKFNVPKFGISQSEALFTVLISYDIKSLTWFYGPTISWTVCKNHTLLLALEMKITTEIQQNVKLVGWLKEKALCLMLTEENKLHFRAKIGRGWLARDTSLSSMKNDPKHVKFDHNSRYTNSPWKEWKERLQVGWIQNWFVLNSQARKIDQNYRNTSTAIRNDRYVYERKILSDNGNSKKIGYGKYLIVPFWYTSATYQVRLVSPWIFWLDQTRLICRRNVPK